VAIDIALQHSVSDLDTIRKNKEKFLWKRSNCVESMLRIGQDLVFLITMASKAAYQKGYIMVKFTRLSAASALAAVVSTSAFAGGIYAETVTSTSAGTCMDPAGTAEICSALGSADGESAPLGADGLIFDFGSSTFNTATLFFAGLPTSDFALEFMGGVSASVTALAADAETLDMGRYAIEVKVAGLFETLSVVPTVASAELDAVGVSISAVPVPASAALLLVGLGAIGVTRRRLKA